MNQTTLRDDTLRLGFGMRVAFMRTLRIPDDGRAYPLPPGLGRFPIRRVSDYLDRVPAAWAEHGGVMVPMYQREAMWLAFSGAAHALKVGIGKVCAISGRRWADGLCPKPQNYVVAPQQPWLDGIASGKGTIRQFVAVPLGSGATVEGQVTGEERFGGIQLQAFPAHPGAVPPPAPFRTGMGAVAAPAAAYGGALGLGAGGRMRQKIYPDPYGARAWDLDRGTRVYVHLVDSVTWQAITGEATPPTPVTVEAYRRAGLPWFHLYDEDAATLDPSDVLAKVQSVDSLEGAVTDGSW